METNLEPQTNAEILGEYAALLWRWAWLLVLCALLAGGTAYWVFRRQTPVYQATALVMVNVAPASQTITSTTLTTSEQLTATYAQVMTTTPVLEETAKRLNLATFPTTASVTVTPIQNTTLMMLVVQDTDRARVALLANTLVQVFADQVQADQTSRYADLMKSMDEELNSLSQQIQSTASDLAALKQGEPDQVKQDQLQTSLTQYRQSYAALFQSYENIKLAEAQSSSGIILKQPPETPTAPVRPRPVLNAILAALASLALAVGAIFLIDFLDDTIRDPQEITRKWGAPVLGTIISYDHNENTLITAKQPRSPITEAFRSLRTNLNFASFNSQTHTILITSPSPEDGKTTIAANLGSVIAQSGRKVVVVDADLRRPRIHKIFRLSNRYGLTDQFLRPEEFISRSLKRTEIDGLQVLTSGNLPPNPAELLGSEKMVGIISHLGNEFDVTIVDAPPLLMVTDALVLAPRGWSDPGGQAGNNETGGPKKRLRAIETGASQYHWGGPE